MAAVASKKTINLRGLRAKYLTKDELKDLESCSKNANTIEKHAECIMPALNAKVYRKEYNKNFKNSQDLIKKLVPSKFSSDGSAEAPESFKSSREMPQTKKMPKPEFTRIQKSNSTSSAQMPSPKPMRKFRTDRIQQRKPSNFRFPQAKRINSAEINRQKFLSKSYRMAKYSTQKIGKKPYRKHFFTAKSLDYRNRLPQLWRTSREKYISKSKEEYYQQKKVGSFTLDQRRRRKRYAQKSASSVYSINDSQRKLTPIGLFAKFFMDDIIAKRNKTARVPWQNMVEKAKKTAVKKKEMKKRMRMMEQTPLEEMAFKFLDRNGSPPRVCFIKKEYET
uniref:Uncharacterized protein n=1 Tax=Panagrolaimus davidi TaxID=227884 RepID=A0A914QGT7_9BILA